MKNSNLQSTKKVDALSVRFYFDERRIRRSQDNLRPLTLHAISIQFPMGYVEVIRPLNCLIACVSVFVGAWIGQRAMFTPSLILAGIVAFIICAFGNIVNDIHDIEIDKINNPHRPLPSGRVNSKVLHLIALLCVVIAILFSLSLGFLPFLVVCGASAVLFSYALFIKKTLYGNIVVAVVSGMSFILGGLMVSNYACLYPFLFALPVHFAREVIKDILDLAGDKAFKVRSFPLVIGRHSSLHLSALLIAVLCLTLPIPFITRVLDTSYIVVLLIAAYPLLIYTIIRLLRTPDDSVLEKLSTYIKAAMAVGLLAMVI